MTRQTQAVRGKGLMFFCLQAGLLCYRVERVKQWDSDDDNDKQYDIGISVCYCFDLIVCISV